MQTIYICDENPVVQQDIEEIIRTFDERIEVHFVADFPSGNLAVFQRGQGRALIINASRKTFGALHFLHSFEEDGGRIICIGTLGPGENPPDSWISVAAPFTTDTILYALNAARTNGPDGAVPAE